MAFLQWFFLPALAAIGANVKRTTTGGRLAATLQPSEAVSLVTGLDFSRSPHASRSGTPHSSSW